MEKENKSSSSSSSKFAKPAFVNVSDSRAARGGGSSVASSYEGVLNSTVKSHVDFCVHDADLSTISGFTNLSVFGEFKSGPASVRTAPSDAKFLIDSNDLNSKQIEQDCWYLKYLTAQTMLETAKTSLRDDEEPSMRDLIELHKASETLKSTVVALENEERLYDNLIVVIQLVNLITKFFRESKDDLVGFVDGYKKLNEMCAEAKNYIDIVNVHVDKDQSLEETLSVELNKTLIIINQIRCLFDESKLTKPPRSKEPIDLKLFSELQEQYGRLKDCVLKYNALQALDRM